MEFTEEERQRWSQRLSNNPKPDWHVDYEHQLHCGFITNDEEKWKNFIDQHEGEIVERLYSKYHSWISLKNGECWQRYYPNQNCCAYRVLKAKVDKDIDKNYFNSVLSQMLVHCYELEWI